MLLASLVAVFFYYDMQQWVSLVSLKENTAHIEQWKSQHLIEFVGIFFFLYVVVAAMSLPGAAVLTLAAGAIFGLLWGTLIVSFASSLGASLSFILSRYLFRDQVLAHFGEKLITINEGIERDGVFYLLTLRLVPVFPFFLINLLMGLSRIHLKTFYWVSQVGMLAGTLVYVNAGMQLSKINTMSDILSTKLLLAFTLLGLLPLFGKQIMAMIKRKKLYAKWNRPKQFDRNLIVIGAGAGGLVTAYIAAAVKAKVSLIEANKMGGDCLNYGCVPSKALIKSAKVAEQMRHADRYGLEAVTPVFSFRHTMARVQDIIRAIEPHDSVQRYTELGVEVLEGYAKMIDPWTVEIALKKGKKQQLTAKNIVIAAGAKPFVPELPGLDDVGYVTSDTLWDELSNSDEPPKKLVVLGGGPIGSELALCFSRLGSKVTQVERGERVLGREDDDVSALAIESLRGAGVTVLTQHLAVRCELKNGKKLLWLEHNGTSKSVEFDALLIAVGRVARLDDYGLENLGIKTNRTIVTNEYLETLLPNIYAAGDVAGPYQFTHAAAHQAWYAAVNALFGQFKRFKVDNSLIPRVTFLDPEIASVGLSENEAGQQGIDYQLTRYDVGDLDRAITESAAKGFIKILTVPGKDKILGVTIVAEHAGELLPEFVLAMKHGLGLNKILGTIHAYPTWADANKYAAGEWKRAHTPEYIYKWLEKYHAWQLG